MKKCIFIVACFAGSVHAQDLSYKKPADKFCQEATRPVKTARAVGQPAANEANADDVDDLIRSPKEKPFIFPLPSAVQMQEGSFVFDSSVSVLLAKRNGADHFLSRLFCNEIADKHAYSIKLTSGLKVPQDGKFILIGSLANPLVKSYCEKKGWIASLKTLGKEGYILSVSGTHVVVAANTDNGAMRGLSSLRQIICKENSRLSIPQLFVKDAPQYPFRGIKLYLPGKENISFFKRFIKDFVALYKFNKIILELNANMRLDKHPELNIGAVQFARHLNFSRLDRPPGVHNEYQNSSHQDNADGQILEKEDVADIVQYIRKFGIEVIPELPSLTHAYYLLAGHEELAENRAQPFPDTYCPLKPEVYKIYLDVLDEYIAVIRPSMIHVGHDEWRMEKDLCNLCRGKDYGALYANDLKKIHQYLAAKGIKTAIWGDHLLESVTEKDHQTWKTSTGYQYKIPGALKPEQVMQSVPKNIVVFNWFWSDPENDKQVSAFGFQQVYGNLRADINRWEERKKIKGVLGGAPSSWAATTEYNIGKDQMHDFLGTANLLWSEHYLPVDQLAFTTEPLMREIHKNLSGTVLPSECGATVSPVDISSSFNSSTGAVNGLRDVSLKAGTITAGKKVFELNFQRDQGLIIAGKGAASSVKVAEIDKDVSSLIFLHACAEEASNNKAYTKIYNFEDTAEPLGWYEIIYEDGLIESIAVRYGVNILDWRWRQRIIKEEKEKGRYNQNKYAYKAAAVDCSQDQPNPSTFFAFEWQNPRLGKKIKEVNLRSMANKTGAGIAILLAALSISENEKIANAKGTEAQ